MKREIGRGEALCAQPDNLPTFDAAAERNSERRQRAEKLAVAICAKCSLREQCLSEGLKRESVSGLLPGGV